MKGLRSLLGRWSAPQTKDGERVYAIGDVHGRPDLLELMFRSIAQHMAARPAAQRTHVIVIGDVIDRGPRSKETLQQLHDARRRMPELVTLLGNHEDMLLRSLAGDEQALRGWMTVGGAETVASFGLPPIADGEDAVPYVAALRRAVPADWHDWLRTWPLSARSGDYFFCHAGIRPGVPLKRQTRRDLLWGADGFREDTRRHGAVIVHGHFISPEVDIRENRIGTDTGAYRSNVLSAVCLDGERVDVISVGDEDAGRR